MASLTSTVYTVVGGGTVSCIDSVADNAGNMWVSLQPVVKVAKVRISDGSVLGTFTIAPNTLPYNVAFDGTNVWVSMDGATDVKNLLVVNSSGVVAASYATGGAPIPADPMIFDGTYIWVQTGGVGTVNKLNLSGTVLASYTPASNHQGYGDCKSLCFTGTYIWFSDQLQNLWQITRNAVLVMEFAAGTYPDPNGTGELGGPVYDGQGCLWMNDLHFRASGIVNKINANNGALIGTFNAGVGPTAMASDGQRIWILNTDGTNNSVTILQQSNGALIGTFNIAVHGPNLWSYISWDGTNMWATTSDGRIVKMTLSGLSPSSIALPCPQPQIILSLPRCISGSSRYSLIM